MRAIWIQCVLLLSFLWPTNGESYELYHGPKQANTDGYVLQVASDTFDLVRLQSLPRYQVTVSTLWSEKNTFIGVRLLDVLNEANLNSFHLLYLEAANDYAITLTGHEASFESALIAYQKGNTLLPISGKGPFWLIWPELEKKLMARLDNGAVWIWNLKRIQKVK